MLLRRVIILHLCFALASAVRVAFIADTGVGNDNPSSSWVDYLGQEIHLTIIYFPVYFCDLNETLAV